MLLTVWVALAGCATDAPAKVAPQPLYFAVEVMKAGKRVGSPRLLGLSGKRITAERRAVGAAEPDYRLVLDPSESGTGWKLKLHLSLPDGERDGEVALFHGEERSVRLSDDTQLRVLLMRVDSDEFRALISTPPPVDRWQI